MSTTTQQSQFTLEATQSLGLANLTPQQISCAVYVTNISPHATVKHVGDFFNFSGNVQQVTLDRIENNKDGKQHGVVVFEEEGAAHTALLMGNAIIVDSPIVVQPYVSAVPVDSSVATTGTAGVSPRPGARSATAVVASLAAAGYLKGEHMLAEFKDKATEFDSKIHFTDRAKYALNISLEKAKEVDTTLHITETLTNIKNSTVDSAKKLDEKIHITEAVNNLTNKAMELGQQAMQNKYVESGTSFLWGSFNAVKNTFLDFSTQTKAEIDKQKQEDTENVPASEQINDPIIPQDQEATTTTTSGSNNNNANVVEHEEQNVGLYPKLTEEENTSQ